MISGKKPRDLSESGGQAGCNIFCYAIFFVIPLKLTWSQQLWLHSSVGRALHRYRRGHGFESR